MSAAPADLMHVIHLIRRSFQLLRRVSDGLNRELGVNASMRAVLEDLTLGGPRSVPQIAAGKDVSRQHIQLIVDALAERKLVTLTANPQHKRSPLVSLTPAGQEVFAEIRHREGDFLTKLSLAITSATLKETSAGLERFLESLRSLSKGEVNDDDTDDGN